MPTRDEILEGTSEQLRVWVAEARGWHWGWVWRMEYPCFLRVPALKKTKMTWWRELCHPEDHDHPKEPKAPEGLDVDLVVDNERRDMSYCYDWPTDIEAAWELVEQLRPGMFFGLTDNNGHEWLANFWAPGRKPCVGCGETAPIAICRAYLLAKMEGE